jgi:hypothetical protein
MKLFKYGLFICTLTIFSPFIAMQSARAGEQKMRIIMSAFQQLGVSAQGNSDVACGTLSLESLGKEFSGRSQVVCVGGQLGYTIHTTVYKHTGEGAFPNDVALKLLKLAAIAKFGEFSITPPNASKSQVAAVQIQLTQTEANTALADAIKVIAVIGDHGERQVSGSNQW